MKKLIIGLLFLVCCFSSMVASYDYNSSLSMTLLLNPDTLWLTHPNGSIQTFNTTAFGTYPLNVSYVAHCMDLNASNLTPYFDALATVLVNNISLSLQNSTTNLPQDFRDNIYNILYSSMINSTEALRGLITVDVNARIDEKCNFETYAQRVDETLINSVLPNKTLIDAEHDELIQKRADIVIANDEANDCKASLAAEEEESKIKFYIIIGVVLLLLITWYFDFGSGGRDMIRKTFWKRTVPQKVEDSSSINSAPSNPSIVMNGSEMKE